MIEIKDLNKTFGRNKVLENINLTIKKGSIYALLGKNGAGKTTLIYLLVDLIQPDSGEIFINGKRHNTLNRLDKRRMGIVCEDLALIEELSGHDYLRFIGKIYQIPLTILSKRIDDLFNYFFEDKRD